LNVAASSNVTRAAGEIGLSRRLKRRLLHHSLLCAASVALTWIFMRLFAHRDLISRVSIGTAYPALLLTSAAIMAGPINVLLRRPNPVSFDLRRDVGIWAGIVSLVHAAFGLNVHLRGRMWLYFVDAHNRLRRDPFGFGNYTGLVAAVVLALLLALSNDLSLRKLGSKRWKFLQRWAYLAIGLTAAHAVLYQGIEKRAPAFLVILYGVLLIVLVLQLAGLSKRRARAERVKNSPDAAQAVEGAGTSRVPQPQKTRA